MCFMRLHVPLQLGVITQHFSTCVAAFPLISFESFPFFLSGIAKLLMPFDTSLSQFCPTEFTLGIFDFSMLNLHVLFKRYL